MSDFKVSDIAYTVLTDKEKVRLAKSALLDICPELNPCIDSDEWKDVMAKLNKWFEDSTEKVESYESSWYNKGI